MTNPLDITFQDPPEAETISLQDNGAKPLPAMPAIENRAAKASYGLGQESPGTDTIQQQILAGGEADLRQQTANNEDIKLVNQKERLISQIAQQRGKSLTPVEMKAVYGLSQDQEKHDPDHILEKLYADKYVSSIASDPGLTENPEAAKSMPLEKSVASNIKTRTEWLQTQLEDVSSKWANTGWFTAIKDYAVEMVPFLPWWRQAQAVDRPSHNNLLPGQTIRDNIMYLYSLPFPQMKEKYRQAMDYFEKSGNTLDAQQFASAMVSYGTSDEYLSNAMGIADYSLLASPLIKGAASFRAARAATKGNVLDQSIEELGKDIPQITQEKRLLLGYEGSNKFTKQPDFFGEQPDQGSFRFMNQAEQKAPPFGSGLPPGKLRATHATEFADYGQYELPLSGKDIPKTGLFRDASGKIRRSSLAYKQGELPLRQSEHQASLDLQPPSEPVMAVKQALADGLKAGEGPKPPEPEVVLGATGNVRQAGFVGALKRILNPLRVGNIELAKEVPTFSNPGGFFEDSKVISRARSQLLTPKLKAAGESMISGFTNLAKVSRITAEQLQVANRLAEESLRKEYGKRLGDGILDVIYTPAEAHPANIDTVSLKVGRPDATLFESKEKAQLFRDEVYQLGKNEAIPRRQGKSWYLEIPKHIDETADAVQTVVTPKNATNNSMINQLLSRIRSAEDIVGLFQRENRQIAVHAPQELRKLLQDFIRTNIKSLPKASRRALEDILRENRDMPSWNNPAERGAWYRTAGEFENAFVRRHKRMPTEAEIIAYDQFKRLSDFDWLIRNVNVYRDKARQGIESFRYHIAGSKTPWFEGKKHDVMPWSVGKADQDAGIWVHNSDTGKGTFYYKFNMDAQQRKELDDLIANRGYRVVQVFDPKTHPLKGIAKTAAGEDLKDQVNYVVTNTWEKSPLSWKQVDYRPGGHVIYPHKWYVAQPVIQSGRKGKFTYFGDNNALNLKTQAEAKKWSERLDYARRLYKTGNISKLHEFIDSSLPHSRDEFYDLFRRSDSPFSLDHPIVYKEAGHNTIETISGLRQYGKGNLIDATKNVHDLSNFMDKSYLMDRDNVLSTVLENSKGIHLSAAEQLDPYIAMNRAMGQGLRNMWMTDYMIGAVEAWIKEFGPAGKGVLKPSDESLIHHPLYFLYNPQYAKVASNQRADLAAAKAAQRAIVNFIGSKSELGGAVETLKMHALNTIYKTSGQGRLLDIALATTSDPVHFLRGIAFHSKLGMFNPIQFFVQANGMAHSIAVAGLKHGAPGMAAAPLVRWYGHNPKMLDAIAGVAEKVGWKREQFKEMVETLKKTGLYQVAGEAAMRDDAFDPHLFRSTLGYWMLDVGPMFFNESERLTRLTAFATAFREFRAVNTAGKIGNREIGSILRRADDLSFNMTRASNAAVQTGLTSIPFQFWTYNARIMEQLLGGRLTAAEKIRMMATYSTLYGIPIGVGAAVGGAWPMYDSVKEAAFKRGINLNEGWMKTMSEGLLAQMISWTTGHDYNVAQRLGPGNQAAVKDALTGDKSFADTMFGASGTILGDIIKTAQPFLYYTASLFNGKEYPIQSSDWMTLFRNISTVDLAAKIHGVLTYGEWRTKTGTSVAKADTMDAAMAIFGFSPREVSDTFLWQKALSSQRNELGVYEKTALDNYRRAMQAAQDGDWASYNDFMTRAATAIQAGDLNYAQQKKLYHSMIDQGLTYSEKIKWEALRQAPNSKFNSIFQNFIKK